MRDGARSERYEILVVDSAPGLFAVNQQGFGPSVIQNFISPAEQPLNTLTNPALPGQYVILWGTGLGAAEEVSVLVGGEVVQPACRASAWSASGRPIQRPVARGRWPASRLLRSGLYSQRRAYIEAGNSSDCR